MRKKDLHSGLNSIRLAADPITVDGTRRPMHWAALWAASILFLACLPVLGQNTPTVGVYDPNRVAAGNANPAYSQAQFAADVAKAFAANNGGVINFENKSGLLAFPYLNVTYGTGPNRFGYNNTLTINSVNGLALAVLSYTNFTGYQQVNQPPSGTKVMEVRLGIRYQPYSLAFTQPLQAVGVTVLGAAATNGFDLNLTATAVDSAGNSQVINGIMIPHNSTPPMNMFIGFKAGLNPIVQLILSDANGNTFELDDLGFIVAQHTYVHGAPRNEALKGGGVASVLPIVFVDSELSAILTNFPGATMDIVMQQCHSGGFVSYLNSAPPSPDWTFASSVTLLQLAYNFGDMDNTGLVGYLDNFTRSWREDAQVYTTAGAATGLKSHYLTAINDRAAGGGNQKILRDPFAPPGAVYRGFVVNQAAINAAFAAGKVQPLPSIVPVISGTVGAVNGFWVSGSAGKYLQVLPVVNGGGAKGWNISGDATMFFYTELPYNIGATDNPQYTSAGVSSDNRSLAPAAGNLYAILVQWHDDYSGAGVAKRVATATPRFAVNIERMYNTLLNTYAVPADNMVVLYYNGTYYDGMQRLPAFTLFPGPNGAANEVLNQVPIDGPTGYIGAGAGFVFNNQAITGQLFKVGGVPNLNIAEGMPMNMPGTNDHLLLYTTGHGDIESGNVRLTYNNNIFGADCKCAVGDGSVNGFDPVGEFTSALTSSLASPNATNDLATILSNTNNVLTNFTDPMDLIQISTVNPIPSGVQLAVNGYSDPSWSYLQPVNDPSATVFDLDPIVPGLLTNTYTYQITVSNSLLYANMGFGTNTGVATDGDINITLNGLYPGNFDPNFISAVIVHGADQETAYVPPDPTQVGQLTAQSYGDELLLTWPAGATNYWIQQNADLNTTNWVNIVSPASLLPELTGMADPTLPMGTNWALISFTNSQMFFRLVPAQ